MIHFKNSKLSNRIDDLQWWRVNFTLKCSTYEVTFSTSITTAGMELIGAVREGKNKRDAGTPRKDRIDGTEFQMKKKMMKCPGSSACLLYGAEGSSRLLSYRTRRLGYYDKLN